MIICVGGTKGGTGKSTVATNLAVMLATSGRDVLLVDADEQGTSTDFTNMRNTNRPDGAGYTCISLTGRAVVTEIRRLTPKYQDVVIDVGGGNVNSQRGALAVCDLYLVPLAPRSFDVWTLDKVAGLIDEARINNPDFRSCAFLNRADASGAENAAAAGIIRGSRRWNCWKPAWATANPIRVPPRLGWRSSNCVPRMPRRRRRWRSSPPKLASKRSSRRDSAQAICRSSNRQRNAARPECVISYSDTVASMA